MLRFASFLAVFFALCGATLSHGMVGPIENLPPVTSGVGPQSSNDGATVTIGAGSTFSDPEDDTLTFSATGLPAGLVIDSTTGTISGTLPPSASSASPFTITVTGSDWEPLSATTTFVLIVTNPPPVTTGLPGQTAVDGGTVALDAGTAFSDPDGDALAYSASGLPSGVSIDPASGTISGTLGKSASATSPYSITVTATDAQGSSVAAAFTLTVTNPGPITTGLADAHAVDAGSVSIAAAAAFSDPDGDALTFSATGLPSGVTLDTASGAISGTLGKSASATSPYLVTVTATDTQGSSVAAAFTLTVTNPGPITTGLADALAVDAGSVSIAAAASFSDPDGDALTFSATGLPIGVTLDTASGAISGTLGKSASATSPYLVTVTATDAQGSSVTADFTLTVTNPVPAASNGLFSTPFQTVLEATIAPLASDADDDALTFARTSVPAHGAVTVDTGGSFTYTPAAGYSGPDSFTFSVTDAQGGATSATVSITVGDDPNTIPTSTGLADKLGVDSTVVSIATAEAFHDADGDPLMFTASGLPAGLAIATHSGTISGQLAADASAQSPYSVTVTATDSKSPAVAASFQFVVTNPHPVAVDDAFSTPYESPLSATVAVNDSDPDGDDVSFSLAGGPSHGSTTVALNGGFTYTPSAGYHGADAFTYTIQDAQGVTATGTVSIQVEAKPNSVPQAVDDHFVSRAAPITGSVALNDHDPDGDVLTFATTGEPGTGTLAFSADGSFTYTPVAGHHGLVSFGYTVRDSSSAMAEASVSIAVLAPPVNALRLVPAVMDDMPVPLVTVADESALQATDADSTMLTVRVAAAHGTLHAATLAGVSVLEGDGTADTALAVQGSLSAVNAVLASLHYNAPVDTCGLDAITITSTDSDGLEDSDILPVTLGAVLVAGINEERILVASTIPASSVQEAFVTGAHAAHFDSISTRIDTGLVQLVALASMFSSDEPRASTIEITLRRIGGTTHEVAVPVLIYSPRVEIVSSPRLNPQTSLYEQVVRVVNSTPAILDPFQLVFGPLPTGVTLYKATSTTTAGSAIIASAAPLAPDGSATYLVEYASENLQPFSQPLITLQLVNRSTSSVPTGTVRAIDRVINQTGRNYLEFATAAGELYWIQYRDSTSAAWSTSPTPVSGSGSSIHWLDAGAPTTGSPPTAARQYRLLVSTASLVPLQITRQPESISPARGERASLSVGAVGAHALSYQWYHDGVPVSGATTASLEITATTPVCEGAYRVAISDGRSTAWSRTARVALAGAKPARLVNLSVRARVGATPLITGFVFSGTKPHAVAARAVGPSLARLGVTQPVRDPRARLYFASAAIAENDDWSADPLAMEADEALERVGAFALEPGSCDAALLRTLQPGAYTLHTENPGEPGIALAELFETGAGDGLINISGRARVGAGEDALIAGFVIDGESSVRVMVRAVGPSLTRFGVADTLQDPRLELHRAGTIGAIATNDNWAESATAIESENLFARLGAFSLPNGSKDSVLIVRLPPGVYTAIARGPDGAAGEALVEVYLITF